MAEVVYSVTATVPDEQTRSEYLEWLLTEHLAEVVRAGALNGRAVLVRDPAEPLRVESQYEFASLEAYGRYVAEEAPRLRAEGLRRFGPERGIRFERRVGEASGYVSGVPRARELVEALRARGQRVATVESCTGGLLGAAITEVAGASSVYLGGWVTYANQMKLEQVGVAREIVEPGGAGAVSGEAAEAMASGGLERSGADWCLSITGIAGPEGGTAVKPVGTVWLGLASPGGARSRRLQFTGGRGEIRTAAVETALHWLLEEVSAAR